MPNYAKLPAPMYMAPIAAGARRQAKPSGGGVGGVMAPVDGPRGVEKATGGWVKPDPYVLDNGLAVFDVSGPICYDDLWEALFEYGWLTLDLAAEIRKAADDPNVRAGVLDLHCPGGSVFGATDLADAIAYFVARKPMHAIAHDLAASLAYWAAAMCTDIACTPTAQLGSVGTIVVYYDDSELFKEAGVRAVPISTGNMKTMGWPGVAITPEMEARTRAKIDAHYTGSFRAAVLKGRPRLTEATLAALDGDTVLGEEAVRIGLADRLVSFGDYMAELRTKYQAAGDGTTATGAVNPSRSAPDPGPVSPDPSENNLMTLDELKNKHPELVTQVEAAAVARVAGAPATFEQLDAAFGAADAAFVTDAQRKKLTMAQASAAFAAHQADQIKTLKDTAATAAAELAEIKAKKPATANAGAPIAIIGAKSGGGGAGGDSGAPGQIATYRDAVHHIAARDSLDLSTKAGQNAAAAKAVKEYRALHQAWREEGFPDPFKAQAA